MATEATVRIGISGWRYAPWRGRGTSPIDPSRRPRKKARDVYAYFDNDAKVKAPRDAVRLAQLCDVEWKPRDDAVSPTR
jgi:uncharacterized protein YecE (DUF72 family)